MNPAKQARKSATYRKTRGIPDETREIKPAPPLVPLRGCRAAWDGEPFPVVVSKLVSKPEANEQEGTDA